MAALRGPMSVPALPALADVHRDAGEWWSVLQGDDTIAKRKVLARLIANVLPVRLATGRYRVVIHRTPLGDVLRRWYRQGRETRTDSPDATVIFSQPEGEADGAGPIAAKRRVRHDTERLRELPLTAFDALSDDGLRASAPA
jgi:hypothetical protein